MKFEQGNKARLDLTKEEIYGLLQAMTVEKTRWVAEYQNIVIQNIEKSSLGLDGVIYDYEKARKPLEKINNPREMDKLIEAIRNVEATGQLMFKIVEALDRYFIRPNGEF